MTGVHDFADTAAIVAVIDTCRLSGKHEGAVDLIHP